MSTAHRRGRRRSCIRRVRRRRDGVGHAQLLFSRAVGGGQHNSPRQASLLPGRQSQRSLMRRPGLPSAAIALPRQIDGIDPAARGCWWLDCATVWLYEIWSRTTSGTSTGSARPDSKVSISLRRLLVRFVRYAVSKLRRAPTAAVR
jgi:hypothetical protein